MLTIIVSILLAQFFQFVVGLTATYRGFDACGFDGWHCSTDGSNWEVTFECSGAMQDARLWVWTARIPSSTTTLAVKNCRRVELHMDCTMGYRSYALQRFRAENVTVLEILKPVRPRIFLHDNDKYTHPPPELEFTNVQTLKWNPENFEEIGRRCRNPERKLERLYLNNVGIPNWWSNMFHSQDLSLLYISNVRFGSWQLGLLSASKFILIENCKIDTLLTGNFHLKSNEIKIDNSSFTSIARQSIQAEGKYFSFTNNQVERAENTSFVINAQTVCIINNTWGLISEGTFEKISPIERCIPDNIYEFRDNKIHELRYFQTDPTWCFKEYIAFNTFPCADDCNFKDKNNINPTTYEMFVDRYSNFSEMNTCHNYPNKTMEQWHMDISKACGLIPTPTFEDSTTELLTTELAEIATEIVPTNPTRYIEDKVIVPSAQKGAQIAIPLSVAAVFLTALAAGAAFWFYKKRSETAPKTITSYRQASKNYDRDNLIDAQQDEDDEGSITIQSILS